MTFEEARPLVEAMLYAYGVYRRQPPAPSISSVYDATGGLPPKPLPPRSSVETYILRHDDEIRLEGALNRLGATERIAVVLRYVEGYRWEYVAKRLNCSRAHAQRKAERALYAIAAQLGLLRDTCDTADAA